MPFRSTTPARAVSTAVAEISRLGLTAVVAAFGRTTQVTLLRDGTEVAVGGGSSVASAYFEALERHLMSAARSSVLLPAREVAAQPALAADLVIQRWAREFPAARAACAAYGDVRYPTFLVDPRYFQHPVPGDDMHSYAGLLRYSSSLGTAAGSDAAEATYHGLCELIEHDGLSHALLRWYVAGLADADEVAPDAAPAESLAEAERAVGGPVRLLDVTTDLGVPVYLAIGGGWLGAGASAWGSVAAGRALDELAQLSGAAVPGQATINPPSPHKSEKSGGLGRWPALERCARLPLDGLAFRQVVLRGDPPGGGSADGGSCGEGSADGGSCGEGSADGGSCGEGSADGGSCGEGSAAWGLAEVSRALAAHGIAHHTREIAPPGSLISVTSTIAPGLERFSLVRHGDPVLPTGRGRRLWPSRENAAA
ncbi:YcaO-like family protein [Actinoplanes sp. CA-142083]|uniref:YcaO-like family protein n=1 Tax=Actinoplanes sp. CA-142083 TaxID=3239903 RepID=UPI003D948CD3